MAYHYPCILFRSHSNQSTKHPVDRRLHYQIQEHSHPRLVAAGVVIASCWLAFLATMLAVVLSIQVADVVFTTVVADQSEGRTQSLKMWPKWHLRLMLLLYRSHGNS